MSDSFDYNRIQEYMASLVPPRPLEMQKMERYAEEHDFPIIGPVAGYYCYQITRLMNAQSVFEMGSGYGYSTAWFAQAIKENSAVQSGDSGIVYHVVWDEKLSTMARGHLKNLGLGEFVEFYVAEANQTLKNIDFKFDLIFCDIDKDGYPRALDIIEEKLRPGGVLIIDNMLWHARIFDANDHSAATEGVREFTRRITTSQKWIVSLAPLRDGMIVAYKK